MNSRSMNTRFIFKSRAFLRLRPHPYGRWLLCLALAVATASQHGIAQVGDTDGDGLPNECELRFGLNPSSTASPNGAADDPDGDGRTNLQECQSGTHPRGTFVRYFAEGATSGFFDARIALANPGSTPANVLLRFLKGDGTTASHVVQVAAARQVTVNPKTAVSGLAAAEFSTVIESDQVIAVDRTMTWDSTKYGAHADTAVVAPSATWYLAEGATVNGFSLFYLLQNPSPDQTASVRVRYLLPVGVPLEKTYTLAPSSRSNIWVNEENFPGVGRALASTAVSAAIEVLSGPPIIAERAMYLNAHGQTFSAGHESAGITAPALNWFLAEGATGTYFDEFVLIANPSPQNALVEASFLLPDGTVHTKQYTVSAQSRFNIWVDEEEIPGLGKVLANTAVSTTIASLNAVPIVVERAMWWPGSSPTWNEAHNSAGATATGTRWALAEGEHGGPYNAQTYILVANTSAQAASVQVRLLLADRELARTFSVAPRSRFNVDVGAEFPGAQGKRFGALVESLGAAPAQIVVERAMYADANGVRWAAGTNAQAALLSSSLAGTPVVQNVGVAAPPRYNYCGTIVREGSSTPVAGATTTILDGPAAGASAASDGSGAFCIANVISSQFRVRTIVTGCDAAEQVVTLSGSITQAVSLRCASPSTYTMSGFVTRWGTSTTIPGASVMIIAGTNGGRATSTGGAGDYALPALAPGVFTVRVTASGYNTEERAVTLDGSKTVNFALTPVPVNNSCGPRQASCGAATAVCADGWLSCSQNRSGTCSSHGGVKCWICPGTLCR
jgi:hypothetical protein